MPFISLILVAVLLAAATAKQCTNITVPVDIVARQGIFNVPEIRSPIDATSFMQRITSIENGVNYSSEALVDYQTVTGTYNISAKFCQPDNEHGEKRVVQVLTHGIGFDKTYWDLPYNNFNYSYIDVAVDRHGYCTLSFDRFGIGNSSHADPYNVVQAPAEVSALYQLNSMLRMGTLPTADHAFNQPGTIVNVGHSFGAQHSYMLAAAYPNVTDALILTGISFNGSALSSTVASFNTKIARLNQPLRFGSTQADVAFDTLAELFGDSRASLKAAITAFKSLNLTTEEYRYILRSTEIWDLLAGYEKTTVPIPQDLPTGYLTWSDAQVNQYNFFYPAGADTNMIYYAEQSKQPFTVGELLTLGPAPAISPFTGPVQVVTGRQDAIFCSGDCLATGDPALANIPAAMEEFFPESSNFSTFIPEAMGHSLNMHYNAAMAYEAIHEFLRANNIVPS